MQSSIDNLTPYTSDQQCWDNFKVWVNFGLTNYDRYGKWNLTPELLYTFGQDEDGNDSVCCELAKFTSVKGFLNKWRLEFPCSHTASFKEVATEFIRLIELSNSTHA